MNHLPDLPLPMIATFEQEQIDRVVRLRKTKALGKPYVEPMVAGNSPVVDTCASPQTRLLTRLVVRAIACFSRLAEFQAGAWRRSSLRLELFEGVHDDGPLILLRDFSAASRKLLILAQIRAATINMSVA